MPVERPAFLFAAANGRVIRLLCSLNVR
jgi:hypothetical protein